MFSFYRRNEVPSGAEVLGCEVLLSISTIPSCMAQDLVIFRCQFPFSWRGSAIHAGRCKRQTVVSPPAEPGVYLAELLDFAQRFRLAVSAVLDLPLAILDSIDGDMQDVEHTVFVE